MRKQINATQPTIAARATKPSEIAAHSEEANTFKYIECVQLNIQLAR